jgi:hypothetical protein
MRLSGQIVAVNRVKCLKIVATTSGLRDPEIVARGVSNISRIVFLAPFNWQRRFS